MSTLVILGKSEQLMGSYAQRIVHGGRRLELEVTLTRKLCYTCPCAAFCLLGILSLPYSHVAAHLHSLKPWGPGPCQQGYQTPTRLSWLWWPKVGSVVGGWGSQKERCQLAVGENPGLAVLCSWRKDVSFRESIMKDLFPAIPNFIS